ncbi:FUSC family protein [uncultured Psychroserpens sp.]|uniref:FUSC family protein n=1 Tax=uncultured Psychroserpens sp. TaxID=255436 RepID=UPI002630441F|nr:FUSC family protein [uncultured Psychroserpens sp.]
MRKLSIVLGFIAAILTVILSVTPLSKMAYIPGIAALILGVITIYLSKQNSKRSIQLMFLLTIIGLTVTTYKAIFDTVEVGNTEELQEKENESQEDAIQELNDLDIEEI